MRLLGSTKKVVNKDKNGENIPKLESTEVVLVHYNLFKKNYQHSSKVLFSFVPNKQFGQLIKISQQSLIMMNTVNREFSMLKSGLQIQIEKHSKLKTVLFDTNY